MSDLAQRLADLSAKATDSDLADNGRYFVETYDDLTSCRHGETGEYDRPHDGQLVGALWNAFRAGELIPATTLAAKDAEIATITAERDALAKRVGEAGLLEWLAANPSLELKYEGWEDDVWEVYRVNGGRSDREWTLVATGDSPADALNTARSTLKGSDHG